MSVVVIPGATGRQRTPKRVSLHFYLRTFGLAACAALIGHVSYSQSGGIYTLGVSDDAKVKFKWKANSEQDLAGYRLYVGTVPGFYTNFVDVGRVTTFELPNLVRGMDYYFALAAYNTAGLESDRAPEITCRVPLLAAPIQAAPQDLEGLVNSPPAISAIPDQTLSKNRLSDPIQFTVSDIETSGASLRVTGYTSNPLVIPSEGLSVEGSDTNRTIVIDPVNGQSGASLITLAVSDGESTTTISFLVTVEQHGE